MLSVDLCDVAASSYKNESVRLQRGAEKPFERNECTPSSGFNLSTTKVLSSVLSILSAFTTGPFPSFLACLRRCARLSLAPIAANQTLGRARHHYAEANGPRLCKSQVDAGGTHSTRPEGKEGWMDGWRQHEQFVCQRDGSFELAFVWKINTTVATWPPVVMSTRSCSSMWGGVCRVGKAPTRLTHFLPIGWPGTGPEG